MAEHSEKKKRKRAEDGSALPRKKAVVQPSQPQILKVSSVQSLTSCPPVIATSPGLSLPGAIKFQTYSKPTPNAPKRSKSNTAGSPTSLLLHSTSHRNIDYTAREEGPGGREAHLKHYVGVFDPSSGQLSVIEAKKMAIRGLVRAQQAPEDDVGSRLASKTMSQLRTDLGEAFGTKKAKKAIAAVTENAISPQKAIVQAGGDPAKLDASSRAIMDSIQEVTRDMATREELQAAVDEGKPVPRGNFDADEIQDVYKPDELIGADILKSIPIKDWQDSTKKRANIEMDQAFVVKRIQDIADGPNAVHRLRIARYLTFLIALKKSLKKGKERGTSRLPQREKLAELLHPAPTPVIENIRRKFSISGEVRKFHQDLLNTYCCVLAAVIANYEFETSDLRQDLKIDEKQFSTYFREIGGKTKTVAGEEKGKKVQIAKLALPLEFPQVRNFSRRR